MVEDGFGELAALSLTEETLASYLDPQFERLCAEWVKEQTLRQSLPLEVTSVGSWWGANPAAHEQTDIDVVAGSGADLMFGECKYRNAFDETEAVEKLMSKQSLLSGRKAEWFYLFSKQPAHKATKAKYPAEGPVRFISLAEMY